jgi:hypothetical protein
VDDRVQFRDRLIEVPPPGLLFGFHGKAILGQQRTDEQALRRGHDQPHERRWNVQRQERNLQHLGAEIKDEKDACRLAVDGQHEAPVLDLVVRVRPLIRVLVR